jgi:hypothetical protein
MSNDTNTDITSDVAALEATVDANLAAYGEPDAGRRGELIAQVWAADGHLIDPPLDARGHDGIDAMFVAVQGMFPAHSFRRTTAVDAHHDRARYGWELVAPDGAIALAGVDYAEVDGEGKLRTVTGFFGEPPAKAA